MIEISQHELGNMLIYTERYCITRMTGASSDGANLCKKYFTKLSDGDKAILLRDIKQRLDDEFWFKMDCDREVWQAAYNKMKGGIDKTEVV